MAKKVTLQLKRFTNDSASIEQALHYTLQKGEPIVNCTTGEFFIGDYNGITIEEKALGLNEFIPVNMAATGIPYIDDTIFYYNLSGTSARIAGIRPAYSSVDTLNIPPRVRYKNKVYTVIGPAGAAFKNNTTIKTAVFPNTITTIGTDAFSGCTGLTTIKGGVTALQQIAAQLPEATSAAKRNFYFLYDEIIPEDSFRGISSIWGVYLSPYVLEIGASAFRDSTIRSVECQKGSQLLKIGDYAFACCVNLSSVLLSSSIIQLGFSMLGGCTALRTLYVPFVGLTCNDGHGIGVLLNTPANISSTETYTVSQSGITYRLPVKFKTSLLSLYIYYGPIHGHNSGGDLAGIKYDDVYFGPGVSEIGAKALYFSVTGATGSIYTLCFSRSLINLTGIVVSGYSLSRMEYDGTQAQWNTVAKSSNWTNNVPFNEIIYNEAWNSNFFDNRP